MAHSVIPDDSLAGHEPHTGAPPKLVLCTDELALRPSRTPDFEAENRAINTLVQALADSPSTILQILAQIVLDLCDCESAGIGLVTEQNGGRRFRWSALAGEWKTHSHIGDFFRCDNVFDFKTPELFKRYIHLSGMVPAIEECLVISIYIQGNEVGAIWAITPQEGRSFDGEDLRRLESLGRFAGAAYQTAKTLGALDQGAIAPAEQNVELGNALRLSEQRFQTLANNMSQLAWICDQLGNVTWYDKRWLEYTGMTFEDMAGWDWSKGSAPGLCRTSRRRCEEVA